MPVTGQPGAEAQAKARQDGLVAAYKPIPGVFDEMIDGHGRIRPAWRNFAAALDRLPDNNLATRFERANQYLRDAGVYYRVYGGDGTFDREWPLSHIPFLIDEGEWLGIVHGLRQRADLLETIVADIYGDNDIIGRGLMPASLVASSPEFLRPMVGAKPKSGHFLHFCAFDLGRGPGGRWWVLGDRTQAPSGAGFALENRVATRRAFSDIYSTSNIHRVAGFFGRFRDMLLDLAGDRRDAHSAIISPGPNNETYFEHAYIARYLGILLLQGEDLVVENGEVKVRTVTGPQPIDVLWRRIDADFMDPLEFRHASRIGTPGMAEAMRNQAASMVNALGTGILEMRALLAFMPSLSRKLRGEELELPNIATWWCGHEAERQHVLDNLERMMIGSALSSRLPFEDEGSTILGSQASEAARHRMTRWLGESGRDFTGQEAVTLSTTPVHVDGTLQPRPVILRVYAARTAEGWSFMPGGFARVGETNDTKAIAMQNGGKAADVWVVSGSPVQETTLMPAVSHGYSRARSSFLPSRTADNLLWLGRYIERSEETVRILRAWHSRFAEAAEPDDPLLAAVAKSLEQFDLSTKPPIPDGLLMAVDSAVDSAGRIRDRFSPDGWAALGDLSKTVHEFRKRVKPGTDCASAMTILIRKITGFNGLVHENMYRSIGWRFLDIGRRIERVIQLSHLMTHLCGAKPPPGAMDFLLEVGDIVMTYRRNYHMNSGTTGVIELLVLDQSNPRAIAFQLAELQEEIGNLPFDADNARHVALRRDIKRLHTDLTTCDPEDITADILSSIEAQMFDLASAMNEAYIH